jgi:damage-control phosphatase, subfamily I
MGRSHNVRTALDCIPCLVRQSLDASRLVSDDPAVHQQILREMLTWTAQVDPHQSPPVLGQRLHRRLRELTGVADAYREAKDRHNALAASLLPTLRARLETAADPFDLAVRLAIAGNVIDLGIRGRVSEGEVRGSIERALSEPVIGPLDELREAVQSARDILYLADNCGEIVLDRLLIERLPVGRVTVAVRGAPILNDATMADARAVGLTEVAEVIDNGSDAPGTILADCSPAFRRRFTEADLVIAKGQGNFESLNDAPRPVFILFKVKCTVVAAHVGEPEGSHVVVRSGTRTRPMALVTVAGEESS